MQVVYEINDNVVYVKGVARGAIYNFSTGKVFSINSEACKIIEEYIRTQNRVPFLDDLEKNGLIGNDFTPREYSFPEIKKELQFIWLELTEACNLRCIHCYEGDEHKDVAQERLSFEQWLSILDQLKQLKCKNIEFIGGEPTVYPHFFDLLRYACSIGHKVDIYSNLQHFSDELVDFIKQNKITVHFSIYGSNSQVHDTITGRQGSFEKTLYWAKKLVAAGIRIVPAITIMRQNQDDYDNTVHLLESIGMSLDTLSIDIPRSTTKRSCGYLAPSPQAARLAYKTRPNFFASKRMFDMAQMVNTCLFGKFCIQPNGNVSPCEFCRDIICGNTKNQSIEEILQSEQLNELWFLDYSKIEKCHSCEYRFACKDCRMTSSYKDIYKKSIRCFYDPELGEWGK
jgi:radical SAM protein with 4Fe4S-binding SPASM domain